LAVTAGGPLCDGALVECPSLVIREALVKHGGPLHLDKIAEAIGKRFNAKSKRQDSRIVIYRAMREGKFFRKEGSNTFALVE
jgi:hypothetical protein